MYKKKGYQMIPASLNEFTEVWDKISHYPENKDIKTVINSWFKELDIAQKINCNSEQITTIIFDFLSFNEVINSFFKIYQKLLFVTHNRLMPKIPGLPEISVLPIKFINKYGFTKNIKDLLQEIKEKNMNKLIVLIGFILIGVGIALILTKQKSKTKPSTYLAQPLKPQVDNTNILVLVVNTQKHELLLNSLIENKKITVDDAESLYRATKFLWTGNKADFYQSGLKQWFDKPQVSEESEYDVNLVQIELKELDSGFAPDTINRLPAFKKLHAISGKVIVSPRLSSKAYENSILYR